MSSMSQTPPDLESAVRAALTKVIDPELRRPITELGMVKSIDVSPDADPSVDIANTIKITRVMRAGRWVE